MGYFKMKRYLVAHNDIVRFHNKVQKFAVFVNQNIVKIHNDIHQQPITGEALWIITADIFALHRSVLSLCSDGWSLATPIILRTMFEMFLTTLVITKDRQDSDFFAFRYMYNFYKQQLKDVEISKQERDEAKKQINDGLNCLDEATKEKAKKFIQDKMRSFWYCKEYTGPTDILSKFNLNMNKYIYRCYAGASHGGLIGLSAFKGQVGDIHPNPRADESSQNVALTHSSRIMLDVSGIRAKFEGLKIEKPVNYFLTSF